MESLVLYLIKTSVIPFLSPIPFMNTIMTCKGLYEGTQSTIQAKRIESLRLIETEYERYYVLPNGNKEGIYQCYGMLNKHDKVLIKQCTYINGLKEGLELHLHYNGKIYAYIRYHHGKRDGIAKEFYESGYLRTTCAFINDKAIGQDLIYYDTNKVSDNIRCEVCITNDYCDLHTLESNSRCTYIDDKKMV